MGAHVSVPLYERTVAQRYALWGVKCTACGKVLFPPREVCPACGATSGLAPTKLSGNGTVYAVTAIAGGGAPPEFEWQAKAVGKYPVALVQLDEGPRIIAQIADIEPSQVTIGMRVKAVLRRIYEEEGVVRYGYKFAPG